MDLKGRVLFITGGSRGIGLEIGKRAAKDGAKIVLAAKTAEPHPKLPGTIYTAADEIVAAGGEALPIILDVRDEMNVRDAVEQTVSHFGGIDICVNNASAISLTSTPDTDMKRYDLMHQINGRGTYLVSKYCIQHLKQSNNAHILNLAPPLDMKPKWFGPHLAYTMAKFTMSMCVLGMAEELKPDSIAVNGLWPRTAIATAEIFTKDSSTFTGNFCIDDLVLYDSGIRDFSKYADVPFAELALDFFLPDDTPLPSEIENS